MNDKQFIACGMYAFNDDLRQSWQALFYRFFDALPDAGAIERDLVFATGETLLRDPALLFGHTCGYPLVTRLQPHLSPFCVPVFDVPGADAMLYSSHFIVPAKSALVTLSDCRGLIAAVNATDSNSGMNLLRHALANLSRGAPFFARVDITGGHLQSLEAVAANHAQLAAIDCVSYQLIADRNPELVARVRSIGFSAQTCGLPFVLPRHDYDAGRARQYVDALNLALAELPRRDRERLHLERFEAVTMADFETVVTLESIAVEKAYATLK